MRERERVALFSIWAIGRQNLFTPVPLALTSACRLLQQQQGIVHDYIELVCIAHLSHYTSVNNFKVEFTLKLQGAPRVLMLNFVCVLALLPFHYRHLIIVIIGLSIAPVNW